MNVDATVLSKWYAPPFLVIRILFGTPILSLSTYASTSPSIISISGANVYPLPVFSTVIENTLPSLPTILKLASTPSPFVITTLGFE